MLILLDLFAVRRLQALGKKASKEKVEALLKTKANKDDVIPRTDIVGRADWERVSHVRDRRGGGGAESGFPLLGRGVGSWTPTPLLAHSVAHLRPCNCAAVART